MLQRRQTLSTGRGIFDVNWTAVPGGWPVCGFRFEVAIFKPQRPQNLVSAGSCDAQRGQLIREFSDGLIIVKLEFPQRPQNFTPSAKRASQREQATIPGITLDCPALLPPSGEGDGWLPPNVFNCA